MNASGSSGRFSRFFEPQATTRKYPPQGFSAPDPMLAMTQFLRMPVPRWSPAIAHGLASQQKATQVRPLHYNNMRKAYRTLVFRPGRVSFSIIPALRAINLKIEALIIEENIS